jgi:hypothetical protein
MHDLLSRASSYIREQYGLGQPRYDFVQEALRDKPYAQLLADISKTWTVVDDTDPNDDVSFNWIVTADGIGWRVAISMVGPFALLIRAGPDGTARVISSEGEAEQPAEIELMSLIRASGLELLSAHSIRLTVPAAAGGMNGKSLYEALFSDSESLPD